MVSCRILTSLIALFVGLVSAQTVRNVPIVVAPNGEWSGPDGPWTTFDLIVGRPSQTFPGVPGLNTAAFIFPSQSEQCISELCLGRKIFNYTNSFSWELIGVYDTPLPDNIKKTMEPTNGVVSGVWGRDAVYFRNSEKEISSEIYVALINRPDFHTGVFGLSPGGFRVKVEDPPALLAGLRQEAGGIPSSSFSYTAGSVQRNSSGSLILGGYDMSRFDPTTSITITMPSARNNTLIVAVELIALSGSKQETWKPQESTGAIFVIDSTLAQIWLPIEACTIFEQAFGLVWNEGSQLYLLDDAAHTRLLSLNPTVNFTIRESVDRAVDYSLPYTAFDLVATAPLVNGSSSRYFPLKRASDPSEYVLGRAFLQETHIIVDYERAVFNLSQAYHQGGSTRIVPIDLTAPDPSSSKYGPASTSLSSGASAGIAVGVTAFVLIAIALVIAWRRRWGVFRVKKQIQEPSEKAELGGDAKPWIEAMSRERNELETQESSKEVAGSQVFAVELEGSSAFCELPDGHGTRGEG